MFNLRCLRWDLQSWNSPSDSAQQRGTHPHVLEIGYTWLAASAQRTRCNTEAKFLLLRHAFETWRVHRAFLRTDERNERSRRAIERLGAKLEGIRRADMLGSDNTVRNSAYYSIVIAEWPDVKARLTRLLG
jgi:N-acetyltransferase